jgi:hypothetical protein
MQYEGEESRRAIEMLVQVHFALDELGLDPFWSEHGVVCHFTVPRNGKTFVVRRLFSAEPGRLVESASLYDQPASADDVEPLPLARHAAVYATLAAAVTPLFIGRLLDQSTAALLDAAGDSGVPSPAKT